MFLFPSIVFLVLSTVGLYLDDMKVVTWFGIFSIFCAIFHAKDRVILEIQKASQNRQ